MRSEVPRIGILLQVILLSVCLEIRADVVSESPSITTQPQAQTVEYGGDVVFTVEASGSSPLAYQWFKNGLPLSDYDNISGSQTANLHVVGTAGNDAKKYSVVITNIAGAITSSVVSLSIGPSLKFSDSFEGGLTNWQKLFDATNAALDVGQNHTVGGSQALLVTNSAQKMFHNLEVKYSCRIIYSFWMYDDGSSLSAGGELRAYSGPGYAKYASPSPGGLLQEMVAGKYNSAFPTNGAKGSLIGEVLDTTKYQGRIWRGPNSGWFNLNGSNAPNRTIGWHQFQIDRAADGTPGEVVSFYVDGVLARTIKGANGAPVNSLVLGGLTAWGGANGSGSAWFDDVSIQAYPGLFDWQTYDSTGRDLFPDWMKLREVGTNASIVDANISTVQTINGSATNDGVGGWEMAGVGIFAKGLRGYLDYQINAPENDAYRIEIEGREKDFKSPIADLPLVVSIDGEVMGRYNLPYANGTNGLVHCFTPYILAGTHTVRLFWDNTSLYRKLYVQAVRLQSVEQNEGNINRGRMKRWVKNRLSAQSGIEVIPSNSITSPVCIEGRCRYMSMMSVSAGIAGNMSSVQPHPGAGYRYYANVPLLPNQPTVVETSFQNGGTKETNEIIWQVTNLLDTNNPTIRQGDSLLFTALPPGAGDGPMTVSIQGVGTVTTNASSPVSYEFDQPGTFTVTGTYVDTGAIGSLTVAVVGASFDTPAPSRLFKNRFWSCTNLPAGVVIDADPRLKLSNVSSAERARQNPALPAKVAGERDFWVRTTSAETEYVLARLGQGGPILASALVQGFRWNIAPDTYLRVVEHNDDGSQVIETAFVMSPLMPSVTVNTQIIVSGVTFDDGTVTKTLTAADFSELGVCKVRFIRGAGVITSVCHTTHLYDGTILLSYQ